MSSYVALLRAVNVGGAGKLAMADLRALCAQAGFIAPRTYIGSGNVLFESELGEDSVKAALEARLAAHAGKPIGVLVRTAGELLQVLADNPFPDAPPNRTVAIFLDEPPAAGALDEVTGRDGEQAALGRREIYVFYPDGLGRSKLKIPAAARGTARNLNTIAKLAELRGGPPRARQGEVEAGSPVRRALNL